jgi:hypothetical protein
MPDLNTAIQLIRQGQKGEAQKILEALIKTDKGNIQAWVWYVETCPTVERRIQVLEACLRANPGNVQVSQGLQALKSIQPAQPSFTPPPVAAPKSVVQQSPPPPSYSSFEYEQKPQAPRYDNTPVYYSPSAATPARQQPAAPQKNPWEMDSSAYVDNSLLSKPKPPARSYAFYDVWMTVMLSQDVESYADVLKDPDAGIERAFVWMACAGVVNALVFPFLLFSNPQFSELMAEPEIQNFASGLGVTAFFTVVMLFFVPIISIINLAINGAIQNFLAVLFGGNGYYSRTVYALAAYLAPLTIVTSLLSLIPLVGQCLGSLLGFYSIYLNIRALRAAHSISAGSAFGVLIAPGILLFIFACVIIFLVGGMAGSTGSIQ